MVVVAATAQAGVNDARWTGGGTSDSWTDKSNWQGGNGFEPNAGTTVNTYYGSISGRTFTDMSGYGQFFDTGHFYFDSTTTQYNLGGTNTASNNVKIWGGVENGPTYVAANVAQPTQTVSANLALGGSSAASNTVSFIARNGDLIFNGNIFGNTQTLSLNSGGNAGRTITMNGSIQNGSDFGGGITVNINTVKVIYQGGATANSYTGVTNINSGELDLFKNNGITAIAGDNNTSTSDVNVSGGTLKWLANNQVGDTATITVSSGTVDLNGKTETLGTLSNTGGTFQTGVGGHLTGTTATIDFAGGTNVINADAVVSDNHIKISGGTNVVQGLAGGTVNAVSYGAGTTSGGILRLTMGGAGIEMTGATLVLNSDNTSPGTLQFVGSPGDLTSHASATTSMINTAGSGTNAGTIDLGSATRTFTIEDGAAAVDMSISARLANGSLTKAGAGVLELSGPNNHAATNINAGTLQADVGSLVSVTGDITVNNGGTLLLSGTGRHIGNAVNVVMNGGTFNTGGNSEPGGAVDGTNHIGSLTLTATSTLDFGAGNSSVLEFGGVGTHTVSTMLNVINWTNVPVVGGPGGDRLLFNGLVADFTSKYAQSDVTFDGVTGYTAMQLAGTTNPVFEVIGLAAVPEPSTWLGGALGAGLILYGLLRRLPPRKN